MPRVTGEVGDSTWVAQRFEQEFRSEMPPLQDTVHRRYLSKLDKLTAARTSVLVCQE